jgi:hypothetical protein
MRYLMDAIGEDASLFSDMARPYALTDLAANSTDAEIARHRAIWNTKEIEPLFFRRAKRSKEAYSPLWNSIHQWAEWGQSEMAWVEKQLLANTSGPRSAATPFQQAFVQDLLALLEYDELAKALRFLNMKRVGFDWVETVVAALDEATGSA